jgi:hypothetical protein
MSALVVANQKSTLSTGTQETEMGILVGIAGLAALVCVDLLILGHLRCIRAERKAIEASTAQIVRQYPELFRDKQWDKYRGGYPGE